MRLHRPSNDGVASRSFVLLEIRGATVLVNRSGPPCQIYKNQQPEVIESENFPNFTGARRIFSSRLGDFGQAGSVEAAIMPVPWNIRMKQKGLKELIFAGTVMSPPLTGLATSRERAEKNPQQLNKKNAARLYTDDEGGETRQAGRDRLYREKIRLG